MSGALADKHIQVRVVEFDGHFFTNHAFQEKTINDRHTVQAAVLEVYAAFPGRCARVNVWTPGAQRRVEVYRRNGRRPEDELSWGMRDLYGMVVEGDEVEIVLFVMKPWGPDARYAEREVPGEDGTDEVAGTDNPGGPQFSKPLAALLQRLGDLR